MIPLVKLNFRGGFQIALSEKLNRSVLDPVDLVCGPRLRPYDKE